jgi:hypothetical protein
LAASAAEHVCADAVVAAAEHECADALAAVFMSQARAREAVAEAAHNAKENQTSRACFMPHLQSRAWRQGDGASGKEIIGPERENRVIRLHGECQGRAKKR